MKENRFSKLAVLVPLFVASLHFSNSYGQDATVLSDEEVINDPNSFVKSVVRGATDPHLISNQTITKLFLAYVDSLGSLNSGNTSNARVGSYASDPGSKLGGLTYDLGLSQQDANTLVSIAQDASQLLSKQRQSAIDQICSAQSLAANRETSISGLIANTKVRQSEIDLEVDRYFNSEVRNEFGADGLNTIREWLSSTFVPGAVHAEFDAEAAYEAAGIDKAEYLKLFCG